jgi:CubicO group peptidase (beta-lactamase class C family)
LNPTLQPPGERDNGRPEKGAGKGLHLARAVHFDAHPSSWSGHLTTTETSINAAVRELIERQIAEGRQLGVQVCAYRHGEKIVDTWAGTMGPEDPRPVQADTLFSSFSTTKGVAATALHILADRGEIDYEAPVAKYWPEFGAHGKDRVTVRQAMSHQAGLHAVPIPLTTEFVCDWERGLDWVANGVPAWEPGTATGYHALTYAWVVGGIVQGATGRHIRDVIREEIAEPLGVEGEMFVGIPGGLEDRLATLQEFDRELAAQMRLPIPDDHDFFKAMPRESEVNYNDMRVRQACLPSANGHFTARALARMYGALANGGEVDGRRLVSRERVAAMSEVVTEEPDRVLVMPMPKSIGFFNGGPRMGVVGAMGPRKSAFGHPGAGGSIAFADPEVGLSIAVTLNKMQVSLQGEGPTFEICDLIRAELGVS